MKVLHPRQLEALEAVYGFIRTKGWIPTLEEVGSLIGVDPAGARRHLIALELKGCVVRRGSGWRSMEITPEGMAFL